MSDREIAQHTKNIYSYLTLTISSKRSQFLFIMEKSEFRVWTKDCFLMEKIRCYKTMT